MVMSILATPAAKATPTFWISAVAGVAASVVNASVTTTVTAVLLATVFKPLLLGTLKPEANSKSPAANPLPITPPDSV